MGSSFYELWIRAGVSCPGRHHVVVFLLARGAVESGPQAARDLGVARRVVEGAKLASPEQSEALQGKLAIWDKMPRF